ncbi:hypothetical protein CA603_38475 [Paraburkholderia hospita]|nr:hypothetical protein CA603_38475 [Paraburkholderia hospita]
MRNNSADAAGKLAATGIEAISAALRVDWRSMLRSQFVGSNGALPNISLRNSLCFRSNMGA